MAATAPHETDFLTGFSVAGTSQPKLSKDIITVPRDDERTQPLLRNFDALAALNITGSSREALVFTSPFRGASAERGVTDLATAPQRPTQAYLSVRRQPYLLRLRDNLIRASKTDDQNLKRGLLAACREVLAHVWEYTDSRDHDASEYFALLDVALAGNSVTLNSAKLRALSRIADAAITKKLNLAAKRGARIDLSRNNAFPLPQMTIEEGLFIEGDHGAEKEED